MGLVRITAPTRPAISLEEAKDQVALYGGDGSLDPLIQRYCNAATEFVERYTGRALITQTWRLSLNHFPCYDPTYRRNAELRIPRPRLQSVTSIQYDDENGITQTLDSSLYRATTDLEPARIEPTYNQVWPAIRCQREAVRITYVAGYGDTEESVPEDIRHAILLMVSQWFNFRQPSEETRAIIDVPLSAKWLLDGYRTGAGAEFYELAE